MTKDQDIQPMDLNDLNNDLNGDGGLMDSSKLFSLFCFYQKHVSNNYYIY